jgi:hypothetical protein
MKSVTTSTSLQSGPHRLILHGPVSEPEFYRHQQAKGDFDERSNRVIRIGLVVRLGL